MTLTDFLTVSSAVVLKKEKESKPTKYCYRCTCICQQTFHSLQRFMSYCFFSTTFGNENVYV